MRTLKLSHEDLEKVHFALNYVFDSKLKVINDNKNILPKELRELIVKDATGYSDLLGDIDAGIKDI